MFISQWLRVTVVVSAIMVWLAIGPLLPAFYLMARGPTDGGGDHREDYHRDDGPGEHLGRRRRYSGRPNHPPRRI